MKHLHYLVILSLVGWSMGSAIAEDTPTPAPTPEPTPVVTPAVTPVDPVTDADTQESTPAMDAARVTQLATTYGVTEEQVQTMRQTQHMGWGEIKNLLVISERIVAKSAGSETPITKEQALAEVLKQRLSGMGIGKIAAAHNVKHDDLQIVDKPGKLDKPERMDKPNKPEKVDKPAKLDKPEKPGKPEKIDKPVKVDKPGKGN